MIPNILCIDDDEISLMLNEFLCELTVFGKKVSLSTRPDEIIEDLKIIYKEGTVEDIPDLMLLDLNMPIMNGWQFLDTLIGIDPDFANKLKIVVLSSSVDPKDKEKAADYPNIILFQPKPMTETVLAELKEHPLLIRHFTAPH